MAIQPPGPIAWHQQMLVAPHPGDACFCVCDRLRGQHELKVCCALQNSDMYSQNVEVFKGDVYQYMTLPAAMQGWYDNHCTTIPEP